MYDDILGPRHDKPKEPRNKINLHEGNCAPDTCGPDCECDKPEEEEISLDEALEKALEDLDEEDPWDGADEDIDDEDLEDIGEWGDEECDEDCEDDCDNCSKVPPSQDIGC